MIPKKIHYCWFGYSKKGDSVVRCIETWKKHCHDYEIIEWNESNFDIAACEYIKEAYEAKKWAFVSDYVRLYVLVNYGGVYFDTDIEVIKSIDSFLHNDAFAGFETSSTISTGVLACKERFLLFDELLQAYKKRRFKKDDGSYDLKTNVSGLTDACINNGLIGNNQIQIVDGLKIYPQECFSPKNYSTGKIEVTDKTYTIHHFSGTWLNDYDKKRVDEYRKIFNRINKIIPFTLANIIALILAAYNVLGWNGLLKKVKKNLLKG